MPVLVCVFMGESNVDTTLAYKDVFMPENCNRRLGFVMCCAKKKSCTRRKYAEFHELLAKRHCHGTRLYACSGLYLHAVCFAFFRVLQLQSPYTRGKVAR